MKTGKRESNLDLLRILCCVAVISIHISSRFKAGITDPNVFGERITTNILTILTLDTLTRFAVPCFVMLAGAFALAKAENADYRSYYRKTFRSIGIPMLLFSFFYVLNEVINQMRLVAAGQAGMMALLEPVKAWILGAPYYHMWYLYTMIGLYILTPVIIRWKNSIQPKTFRWCALALLALGTVSGWTSQYKFRWDMGAMFCYTGYYVMGYLLRDLFAREKSQCKGLMCIAGALAVELVVTAIQYRHTMAGLGEGDEVYTLIGSLNPLIVLASVLMFAGFCQIKADVDCGWFVKRSFLVYLIHAGVLTQGMGWILEMDTAYCGLIIPAAAIVVLVISFGLALVYEKLWSILEKRWDLSRRLTDLLLPEK